MKRIILLIMLFSVLLACKSNDLQAGNYVVEHKNDRPIYLIDISTGERLVELEGEMFFVAIGEGRKIASFYVELVNFNTESSTTKDIELGFFNGKVKKTDTELRPEAVNDSVDAVIIMPDYQLTRVDDNQVVGVTLANYGPTLYHEMKGGYCYFYLGINYLRVPVEATTLVKKPEKKNEDQIMEGDLGAFAFNYLSADLKALIADTNDVLVDQINIGSEGEKVYNRDQTREYVITNQEVIAVTFVALRDANSQLTVYLDPNTYGFLGLSLQVFADFEF